MFHPTRHPSSSSSSCLVVSPTKTTAPTPTSTHPFLSLSSSSSSFQVGTEMACVEAALKSSFRSEAACPLTSSEEFCGSLGVGPCEDFLVDELLDFSNDDGLVEEEDVEKANEQKDGCKEEGAVVPCKDSTDKNEIVVVQTGELNVPAEELANLEWLSHFVEDSFSGFSSPFPAGVFPGMANSAAEVKEGVKPEGPEVEDRVFNTQAHARSRRSQRSRMGGKIWSPSLSDTSSSSSSSSSYNCFTSDAVITTDVEPAEPPAKKRRKWGNYGSGPGQTAGRRCSHCGVQKTPQWRAGPLGSKTLCNACGVRFKSGRLFPEYRPACSPTFSSELHSNHHRKVLEMRQKKESSSLPPQGQPEPGFAVPSF